ncbi:MFS transporter [Janthinobacterium sp. MDT1-19]|uniref:MFS transporter n=1 Tax=Janthinobacterium sp. MDT1-19 TaxID=1259339 RepID=UPI003F200919
MLIAARAIQGVGAAILAPSTLALLQTTFAEGRERTRAIALYSAVAGIAASVGLVLGGVLAEWLSWGVGFFINLPIGAAMLVAARRYIAENKTARGRFDVACAVSSTLGMTALVYGLIRSAGAGWGDALTQGTLEADGSGFPAHDPGQLRRWRHWWPWAARPSCWRWPCCWCCHAAAAADHSRSNCPNASASAVVLAVRQSSWNWAAGRTGKPCWPSMTTMPASRSPCGRAVIASPASTAARKPCRLAWQSLRWYKVLAP